MFTTVDRRPILLQFFKFRYMNCLFNFKWLVFHGLVRPALMNLDASERFAGKIRFWSPKLSVMDVHTCLQLVILYGLRMKTCSWNPAVMLGTSYTPDTWWLDIVTQLYMGPLWLMIFQPQIRFSIDMHLYTWLFIPRFVKKTWSHPGWGHSNLHFVRTSCFVSRLRDFLLFPHMHGLSLSLHNMHSRSYQHFPSSLFWLLSLLLSESRVTPSSLPYSTIVTSSSCVCDSQICLFVTNVW